MIASAGGHALHRAESSATYQIRPSRPTPRSRDLIDKDWADDSGHQAPAIKMVSVFAVPVFFICFRECLETSIIVSVLLSFIKQTLDAKNDVAVHRKLVKQVWLGVGLGLMICLCIGAGIIGAFYGLGKDQWSTSEDIWEGVFGLLAAIIISIMGAALLRVSKLQDKWRVKIANALDSEHVMQERSGHGRVKLWSEKYAMFVLPFITVLREGLEAVIFIGGVGLSTPAEAFPLAVACGLGAGALVGCLLYKLGNRASMQIFLIVSTCFLYLVAAGLFSKAVWSFEINAWNKLVGGDAAEVGSGPGSYDMRKSVWHVNCCNPETSGGWGIFNAIFGWQNSATYGSVISYNLYWLVIIASFLVMRHREKHGQWPLQRSRTGVEADESSRTSEDDISGHKGVGRDDDEAGRVAITEIKS